MEIHDSQKAPIFGARHVGLVVRNLEKSSRFYRSLGFVSEGVRIEEGVKLSKLLGIHNAKIQVEKLHLLRDEKTIWRESGFRLELIEYCCPIATSEVRSFDNNIVGKIHLCFSIKGLAYVLSQVEILGGKVLNPIAIGDDKSNSIYINDPDGTPIELIESWHES